MLYTLQGRDQSKCTLWRLLSDRIKIHRIIVIFETCGLENDMMNLENFHQNTYKCQKWYFQGILLFKVENA